MPDEGKDTRARRRRQHLQQFTPTNLPPLTVMETPLFLHINTHLPESEESEQQPGVHGFVLHSSEKKLHPLLHSWKMTVSAETLEIRAFCRQVASDCSR